MSLIERTHFAHPLFVLKHGKFLACKCLELVHYEKSSQAVRIDIDIIHVIEWTTRPSSLCFGVQLSDQKLDGRKARECS